MALTKRYDPGEAEPRWQARWQAVGSYHFSTETERPVYSIDTPPPTVSGKLHLGHVYSYTHTDLMARFRRMAGYNVFYPMGYDDNGLATERLLERWLGISAAQVGRRAFIVKCLQVSEEAEKDYQALWQRLGLSIDWRYTYRTIDENSRRISQRSFIDLYRKGLVYRKYAPAIWCPECQTAIAQAELNDLERPSEFVTLAFPVNLPSISAGGGQGAQKAIEVATTRPELLPACVAVFVHPEDERYRDLIGKLATVPLSGQKAPILADPAADPEKGTGAVMCCTFGDTTDIHWWHTHKLPLVEAIGKDGRLTAAAGVYAGLPVGEARRKMVKDLEESGLLMDRQPTVQSVRVHERCDTPVEYILTWQWFIRVLDYKDELLAAGEQINWYPEHMHARYRSWVENLAWDWCISRQRYFGVPFPLWYCSSCGEVVLADEERLPVDPAEEQPNRACPCGGSSFIPEADILDTWPTSAMSPQIVGRWLTEPELYRRVFPFSLRPQGHEIIRTWAFYTIAKSHFHFGQLPWKDIALSGWGIAGEGMEKISKSRGGGPMAPMKMIERYSADGLRYWAASTGPGKDAVISEEKIQAGARLVNKLWNVARFSERFLVDYRPPESLPPLSPADRWILARTQQLIRRVTELFQRYDYAAAKSETEGFFWRELADNYLEMCKQRLYAAEHPLKEGARYSLYQVLLAAIQLFAPFLPHITEEIYQGLFAEGEGQPENGDAEPGQDFTSIHHSTWPVPDPALEDPTCEAIGETLVEIATAVRRYKSERNLPLGTEMQTIQLATADPAMATWLREASPDLASVTRAERIEVVDEVEAGLDIILNHTRVDVAITGID